MDDDVSVASDGRSEVSVERNIESVVFEELLLLHLPAAEVQRHLESAGKRMLYVENTYAVQPLLLTRVTRPKLKAFQKVSLKLH